MNSVAYRTRSCLTVTRARFPSRTLSHDLAEPAKQERTEEHLREAPERKKWTERDCAGGWYPFLFVVFVCPGFCLRFAPWLRFSFFLRSGFGAWFLSHGFRAGRARIADRSRPCSGRAFPGQ